MATPRSRIFREIAENMFEEFDYLEDSFSDMELNELTMEDVNNEYDSEQEADETIERDDSTY